MFDRAREQGNKRDIQFKEKSPQSRLAGEFSPGMLYIIVEDIGM